MDDRYNFEHYVHPFSRFESPNPHFYVVHVYDIYHTWYNMSLDQQNWNLTIHHT